MGVKSAMAMVHATQVAHAQGTACAIPAMMEWMLLASGRATIAPPVQARSLRITGWEAMGLADQILSISPVPSVQEEETATGMEHVPVAGLEMAPAHATLDGSLTLLGAAASQCVPTAKRQSFAWNYRLRMRMDAVSGVTSVRKEVFVKATPTSLPRLGGGLRQ